MDSNSVSKWSFISVITSSFLCFKALITYENTASTSYKIFCFFSSQVNFVSLISSNMFSHLSALSKPLINTIILMVYI